MGGGYNNGDYAQLYFPGTQTLGGTGSIIFGIGGNRSYLYANGDNASNPANLTIGSGVTISGGNGYISGYYGGDSIVNDGIVDASASGCIVTLGSNGAFTNNGTLEATSGGTLSASNLSGNAATVIVNGSGSNATLNGTYVLNQSVSVAAGTALTLNGNWSNTAALSLAASATLYLGGSFTVAGLGTFTNSGGTVNLTGTLNNAGATLALSSTTGSWNLDGGTISGGTVSATPGVELILTNNGGALSGVTIATGTVVDGTQNYYANASIYGGLTLDGTLNLGGEYNNGNYAQLNFPGTQTLGGTGSIVFGIGYNPSYLYANGDNCRNPANLTIGSGMTISGGNG